MCFNLKIRLFPCLSLRQVQKDVSLAFMSFLQRRQGCFSNHEAFLDQDCPVHYSIQHVFDIIFGLSRCKRFHWSKYMCRVTKRYYLVRIPRTRTHCRNTRFCRSEMITTRLFWAQNGAVMRRRIKCRIFLMAARWNRSGNEDLITCVFVFPPWPCATKLIDQDTKDYQVPNDSNSINVSMF